MKLHIGRKLPTAALKNAAIAALVPRSTMRRARQRRSAA